MPLNANEEALVGQLPPDHLDYGHQRLDHAPPEARKIGTWTLMARSIGSGIFFTPHRILAGTGCVGGALFLLGAGRSDPTLRSLHLAGMRSLYASKKGAWRQ